MIPAEPGRQGKIGAVRADPGVSPTSTPQRLARWLTALYAAATVVAAGLTLFGRQHRGAHVWEMAFGLANVPLAANFLSVVVLAVVTRMLVTRKRLALFLVGFFQLVGLYVAVLAFVPGEPRLPVGLWQATGTLGRAQDVLGGFVAVLLLFLLWRGRRAFRGRLQPGSWLLAGVALAVGLAVTGLAMWLLSGGRRTSAGQLDDIIDTVTAVVGGRPHTPFAGPRPWIVDLVAVLAGLTVLTAIGLFLASARPQNRWSPDRELALRRLLADYGPEDSLAYFATRRDKSVIFSPDGRAAVSYRVIAGVTLASGDPLGHPDSWRSAIAAWRSEAVTFGWQPAVLAAGESGARAYAAAGLRVLVLGDEAVLDAEQFALRAATLTAVRRAAATARRAGITVRVRRQSELGDAELRRIADRARAWLGEASDRGFSMALNRPADPTDGRCVLVTAHDAADALVGVLRFVPWGRRDLSLDLMRRSPDAGPGVTELMVRELLGRADSMGVRRVSLNFCMFRGVFGEAERIGGRSLTRFNAGLLGFFDRFWQLERLYRSNQKYQPDWVPRFLCYDDVLAVPQVAVAAAAAEGFLPWPRFRQVPVSALPAGFADRVVDIEAAPPALPPVAHLESAEGRHRLTVADRLRSTGDDPWPAALDRPAAPLSQVSGGCWSPGVRVDVTGRIRSVRDHGGVVFADLVDGAARLQLVVERAGGDLAARFAADVDSGDLIRCCGVTGASRTGTASLLVDHWRTEAKALRPIRWALTSAAGRSRPRAEDLITRPDQVRILRQRSAVLSTVRGLLIERGFCEVETPILQTVHGGARARPFRTHLIAYGADLSLRIAPELYLKQLLVGGLGPVFEIGRNFRNEGVDASHNPEFTSLEAYQPGADYRVMLDLTRELVQAAAVAVHGRPVLPLRTDPGQGVPGPDGCPAALAIDGAWPVVPVLDAVSAAVGRPVDLDTDPEDLQELARRHEVVPPLEAGPGAIIEAMYADLVEARTIRPTFYVDFPVETSPLTRAHRCRPGLVERWDLVIGGTEIGTAYTELTDPLEQRRRLTEQSLKAAAGDPEAMEVDETFLAALEYGMPPAGGMGLGIDRLMMVLTGRSIRSVLAFPLVRPSAGR